MGDGHIQADELDLILRAVAVDDAAFTALVTLDETGLLRYLAQMLGEIEQRLQASGQAMASDGSSGLIPNSRCGAYPSEQR